MNGMPLTETKGADIGRLKPLYVEIRPDKKKFEGVADGQFSLKLQDNARKV